MQYSSIICSLCLFFMGITGFSQPLEPYIIRNFTKKEYKAESQNWSITRDQNGFIYAANNAGLLEFDGVEWNFYPAPNGTVIRSVAVDQSNRIYTSGYREIGYWERDHLGDLSYHSLNGKALPLFSRNEEFWNTKIIGEKVYFHSFTSVFIYENGEFRVVRPGHLVHSISTVEDRLCVHLDGLGLYMLEDTLLKPFLVQPVLRNDIVHFCIPLADTSLLVGTASSGLFLYKDGMLTPYLDDWKDFFSENKINRGVTDGRGNIIIGTLLEGICIFDQQGKLLHHINNSAGLQNNTVLGIHWDDERNIWLSLDKGVDFISFLVDPSYTIYQYEELGAVYSTALFRGDLYLCTNQGVFYRDWENEKDEFRIIQGTQGQAWSCDIFDNQLIISHNGGTFRIEDHVAERISLVSGGFSMTRNPVRDDMLVQCTYSNIVFFEKIGLKWQYKYQLPEFNDLIRYIELDRFNNIWASHMHRGVYRLKLNDGQDTILNVQYYGDSIFGKDYGIQVFTIEKRIVFTTGQQIFTYDDLKDSIVPHLQLNQELGKYSEAHRVVAGPDHHYWFIGNQGIGLFRIYNSVIQKIKAYPIGLFKDQLITGYENIFPLGATEGILCLENGYAILRAGLPDLSELIGDKRLSLNSIEISGRHGIMQKLPVQKRTLHIPFNKNSLSLSYAFPLFSNEPLAFQAYVEGLDNQWREPADKPDFQFTRIPSGEYRILIRAFNRWNRSSVEEHVKLLVTPPWYRGRWSLIIYALLLMVLLFTGRHILISRIRSRETKIQESKEKELIKLRNENLNAELSFKSQELANSTMSIIKKNEFLLELKETIRSQKDDLGTRYPEKYYSKLVRKIDHNISSLDDWKVFEFHFEKAHEKFLQTLMNKYPQLSHSDLRLCAYLRMNLSSKEIAPLLRISYRGVENHRYRLRKKLGLQKEENLTDIILSI